MMLYKYFSPDGTARFLSTMALRLTPPDQFNDPFEMCPPIDVVDVDEVTSFESVKDGLINELLKEKFLGVKFSKKWRQTLASELLAQSDSEQTLRLYAMTPGESLSRVKMLLPHMRQAIQLTLESAREEFPEFKLNFQNLVHSSLREALGALCFSKNGKHPLMWAHYADEHKGAVIKFKTDGPCFNRGDYAEGIGKFVDVSYTESRPVLNASSGKNVIMILALSKAIEWKYEEEMRFLLPLNLVDKVIEKKYHLININPSSVQSVILGCRASDNFVDKITEAVRKNPDMSHVKLYKSEPCKKDYALNYIEF
jgi:hypothetical protein